MQWPDFDAFTTQVVAQVLFTQKETVWPIESLLVLRAIQSVPILALFITSLTFPINSPPWSSHHPPTLGTIYSNQINLTSCTYLGSGRKTEQPGEAHVPRMCTQRAAEIRIEVTPTLHSHTAWNQTFSPTCPCQPRCPIYTSPTCPHLAISF